MHPISELSTAECARLLHAGVFGRIALTCDGRIEVLPVNYTTVGDAVLVRTTRDSLLHRYGDGADLVFQVDHTNYERWRGWSVVARGIGEVSTDGALTEQEHAAPKPPPWVRREEPMWVRLRWQELTGRKVGRGWNLMSELPVRRTAASWG